jgi:hypothetical protein
MIQREAAIAPIRFTIDIYLLSETSPEDPPPIGRRPPGGVAGSLEKRIRLIISLLINCDLLPIIFPQGVRFADVELMIVGSADDVLRMGRRRMLDAE